MCYLCPLSHWSTTKKKISRGQVNTVLPFGNSALTAQVSGETLKAILENSVSSMPTAHGRFAQVSGLCFTYNIDSAVGSRVVAAKRQAVDGSCTGDAIDFSASSTYSITVNDFMAEGGDGYPVVIGTTREICDQEVSNYIASKAPVPISPSIQGRISCEGSLCPALI